MSSFRVSVLAVLATCLSLVVPATAAAQAGSIAGTVEDSSGNPADGFCASAQQAGPIPGYAYPGETSANGEYEIGNLPPGPWIVKFSACGGNYSQEYYDDKPSFQTGNAVTVTNGITTTGIDATLAPGGQITGTVRDESGAALADVCIGAQDPSNWTGFYAGRTDAHGKFEVGGLSSGTYLVSFYPCAGSSYAHQYYDDAVSFDDADLVPVTAGKATAGIDAVMHPSASIVGSVVDENGDPLSNVCVYADAADLSSGGGDEVTDAAGQYELDGLAADSYRVLFRDCGARGYAPEYYDDGASYSQADPVTLSAGQSAVAHAQLAPGATIQGTVTGPSGSPQPNVCIHLQDQDEWGAGEAMTDANGNYTIAGLNPQAGIRARFRDCFSGNLLEEWWNNKPSYAQADVVPLTGGAVTDVDVQMNAGGIISGRVTNAAGVPISGACVDIEGRSPERWVMTDANGFYSAAGVPGGDHFVRFSDCWRPSNNLQPEWFNNELRRKNADPVSVTTGVVTPNINAALGLNVAPAISIVSGPAGTTKATTATIAFETSEDLGTECKLDNGPFEYCESSPVLYEGLTPGTHTVTVRATDFDGTTATDTLTWTVDPNAPGEAIQGTVPAGGVVSTDPAGTGATPTDPLTTAVLTPTAGTVTIAEGGFGPAAPSGFAVFGTAVSIQAPQATVAAPLAIAFRVDASAIPSGTGLSEITVVRDGVAAGECPGAATANPDPCVRSRATLPDGDVQLLVLATHASGWSLARAVEQPPGGNQPPAQPPTVAPWESCVVPKVTRKRLGVAKRLLAEAGCTMGKVKRKRAKGTPGIVLRQTPQAGTKAPPSTPVRLVVRKRP